MISVEDAQALIAAAFRPLPAEVVSLTAAHGRILARPVVARRTQPPADVSAMDGWAVRAADLRALPATLRSAGVSAAGAGFAGHLGPDETIRIFTGAPVPAGADTVVVQEDVEVAGQRVSFTRPIVPGRHIRAAGQDFAVGDALLQPGRPIGAREIALAAAADVPWLAVRRRPRVAVLSTGDELVLPGEPRGPAQIVETGGFTCTALLREFGADPSYLGIARDDEASLEEMLAAARGADLLLTIGGVSVGDFDLVGRVLGGGTADLAFHKVAIRPGKPLLFGRIGELPVLGLPGNPVSAFVTLMVFGRAAIDAMLGVGALPRTGTATLGRDLPANGPRQDYLRASLCTGPGPTLLATPFAAQDSSLIRLLADAGCLVIRPPSAAAAEAGTSVPILLLGGFPAALAAPSRT